MMTMGGAAAAAETKVMAVTQKQQSIKCYGDNNCKGNGNDNGDEEPKHGGVIPGYEGIDGAAAW